MTLDFDNITAEDLGDDDRLKLLYLEAVRRKFWPNNLRAALEFFCYAEKALHDDKHGTPGKLFYTLVKRKNSAWIPQDSENRALLRLPSGVRQELVDAADGLNGLPAPTPEEVQQSLFGRDIGYYHGIMMQCFLPQKPLAEGKTRYVTSHGRASMVVQAGILADPDKQNTFMECAVPSGSKARLILPYIIGYAVVRNTPEVDLGRSLRHFMDSIGMPIGGYNGKELTKQVQNVAAADFILGEWQEEQSRTRKASVAKEVSFWLERRPDQMTFWTPTMVLSDEFYKAIQTRRVPVDMKHLIQLTKSPRRMDLYCWFSYRLPRIRERNRIPIPLRYLQPIFAPDITDPYLFKQRFKSDLKAIAKVYRGFNLEIKGDILWLTKSPSPVPSKVVSLL